MILDSRAACLPWLSFSLIDINSIKFAPISTTKSIEAMNKGIDSFKLNKIIAFIISSKNADSNKATCCSNVSSKASFLESLLLMW